MPGSDRYTEGAYATGNRYNGIRDFLAGRPMGGEFPEPGKNPDTDPLNYGDFGFDNVGPEVHADGEIWVAVQIDLRDLFLYALPVARAASATSPAPAARSRPTQCPGDRRWIQDYYDAMVLMPRNTTMIQARDAMLAADLARFGGANQDLLWQAFAHARLRPVPDTVEQRRHGSGARLLVAAREQRDAQLLRDSKDGTPLPVNANIYVGDYEARVDADRGHRSGDRRRDDERQPRQHGAVRADRSRTRWPREAMDDVQLRRQSHPATASSASW